MLLSWQAKKEKIKGKFLSKKLFIFDLDGTLAPSKGYMSKEMEDIFCKALRGFSGIKMAVISGCKYEQMYDQFAKRIINRVSRLDKHGTDLLRLFLLPTSGSALYKWDRQEKRFNSVYKEILSLREKTQIINAFDTIPVHCSYYIPNERYGEVEEDRGSQITFSLRGQDAPLEEKMQFDPDGSKRRDIQQELIKMLHDFEVTVGGTTSIDITRRGMNKAYGVKKLLKHTSTFKKDAMFIGDALQDGGNDAPVKSLNIDCVSIKNTKDTYELLVLLTKELLAQQQQRYIKFLYE